MSSGFRGGDSGGAGKKLKNKIQGSENYKLLTYFYCCIIIKT